MLEIKNTEVFGLERAIRASGNAKSIGEIDTRNLGDLDPHSRRAKNLGSAAVGSGHDHYLLGIHVQFDIKYPQYWTIEAERYHNFEIITSQSKMHKLTAMGRGPEFATMFNKYVDESIIFIVQRLIEKYNDLGEYERLDSGESAHPSDNQLSIYSNKSSYDQALYEQFMKCVSSLPMGFEMWMSCDLTYLQLKTMYSQRRGHKLREDWGAFCDWCESLPMFKELIGIKETSNE